MATLLWHAEKNLLEGKNDFITLKKARYKNFMIQSVIPCEDSNKFFLIYNISKFKNYNYV